MKTQNGLKIQKSPESTEKSYLKKREKRGVFGRENVLKANGQKKEWRRKMFHWKDLGLEPDLVILICLGIIILLLILVIVLFAKQSGLKNRMREFMNGSDGKSLEEAFQRKFENMDFINGKLVEIDGRLEMIDRNLLITFQKYSVVKYDAFDSAGGQLSFAMALLTKENNGFIINTVHSNATEGYFSYLKEVKNGQVNVELAEEEARALEMALGR